MKVISFKNALKMDEIGFRGEAEKSYIFHVIPEREFKKFEGKEWSRYFERWDENKKTIQLVNTNLKYNILSDRFYDSWTDKAIPAYNIVELCQFLTVLGNPPKFNGKIITAVDDPEEISSLMIECKEIIDSVNT